MLLWLLLIQSHRFLQWIQYTPLFQWFPLFPWYPLFLSDLLDLCLLDRLSVPWFPSFQWNQ